MAVRDLTLQQWLVAAAWLGAAWAFLALLRAAMARLVAHRVPQTATDEVLLEILRRTRVALFILPVTMFIARGLLIAHRNWLAVGAGLSIVLQIAMWVGGLTELTLKYYERRRSLDPNAVTTLRIWRVVAVVMIWVLALLVALGVLGVDVRTLLAGLGIGGVAVALALQNVLSDLFASLAIVIDKLFVVGDFISFGGEIGTVERIGVKTTRVRALSGEELVVSNSELLKVCVHNMGRMQRRRVVCPIRVAYETPPPALEQVPAMLRRAVESQSKTQFDRAHLAAFGALGYDFELVYYVLSADYVVYMDTQQAVLATVASLLGDAEINIARQAIVDTSKTWQPQAGMSR